MMAAQPLSQKRKLAVPYTDKEPGTYSAVFEVEGVKLYVIHELLGRYSKVFRTMFNGKWQEGKTQEVKLPGKSLESVIWMLDYVYPHTNFQISDEKAMAILPLAVEYQMDQLKQICEDQLMERRTSINSMVQPLVQPTTLLAMVTLADGLQLKELTTKMIEKCAARLTIQEIDTQKEQPENSSLSAETYLQLIRRRLTLWDTSNTGVFGGVSTCKSCLFGGGSATSNTLGGLLGGLHYKSPSCPCRQVSVYQPPPARQIDTEEAVDAEEIDTKD